MSTAPPARPATKALNCPKCGAALVVRSMSHAVTIVCEHCQCLLDARDPNLQIVQQFNQRVDQDRPLIPLGTRGKFRGTLFEVIGFQRRTINSDGVDYSWHEYLLFNPYKGFRYLTEYQGHWNYVTPVTSLPVTGSSSAEYQGQRYRHFQTASAQTTFVLGEFPWQVRYGERARCSDYVHPPFLLSSEAMDNETTWSYGEYVSGSEVWKSFNLPGRAPAPIGVFENQPSPVSGSTKRIWAAFAIFFFALVFLLIANFVAASNSKVFDQNYSFAQNKPGQEPSFVTPVFELTGRPSDVEVATRANVNNEWIYLNFALINDETGQAYDFGREVSYYHGYDSDGSWTEGSDHDSVIVPDVPSGKYYLRVEPETDGKFGAIAYSITVTRDVPVMSLYLFALIALFVPAVFISWRAITFEQMRWAESDHPWTKSSD
jgi:hypothetical protein